jgi:hypothetical protein
MKLLLLLLSLFSFQALADWESELTLGIDGETFKKEKVTFINAKETSLTLDRFLLKMTLSKAKEEKSVMVKYSLHEKKGEKMTLVTKGEDELEDQPTNDIFAKGEKGQPNTILTLKMKQI